VKTPWNSEIQCFLTANYCCKEARTRILLSKNTSHSSPCNPVKSSAFSPPNSIFLALDNTEPNLKSYFLYPELGPWGGFKGRTWFWISFTFLKSCGFWKEKVSLINFRRLRRFN
jgi:hypothetical protein